MFFLRLNLALLLCLSAVSCYAPVYIHEVKPEQPTAVVVSEASIQAAARKPNKQPLGQIAGTLDSLRTAYDRLGKGDETALPEYNFLLARLSDQLKAAGVRPWMNQIEVSGSRTRYVVRGSHPADLELQDRTIIATDTLEFRGSLVKGEAVSPGIGAPLLAIIDEPPTLNESFDKNFRYRNLTAVVHFNGDVATVALEDPHETEFVSVKGLRYPLHSNFGANVYYALSTTRIDKLGLSRLLNPERFSDTCRLSRLQPYDPDKIPVLMVHGLDSTPATWMPMYIALMADEDIREHYQFWVFSYSSGYPYPYSATLLRNELDRMRRAFPGHKDIVLFGHSMGSLISRLMVTDVGDEMWQSVFGSAPDDTKITGDSRELLEDSLIFNSREEIKRVVFFSGPHRGARMATSWIGRLGSKLVRAPAFIADTRDAMVSVARADPAALALNRAPNSIDTLAPNNRFIREINKFPIDSRIPFHSVIGDRGKGDTPNSSDGVVDYWSSHLDGAVSEKIVPSGHGSHAHPEGIAEARRILLEHAKLRH